MSLANYTALKASITDWSKRNDIATLIDDFIDLAEADMWGGPPGGQPLRIRDMDTITTDTASTSDRFLSLPASFLEMRKIRLYTSSQQYDLSFRVPESLNVLTSSGVPTDYTITSQIEFNRTASSAFTVEMQYYKKLTALSAGNTTNAILTSYPTVYLYGALYHFGNWAKEDDTSNKYLQLFIGAINSANKADKKGSYGPAKAMRVEGSTP